MWLSERYNISLTGCYSAVKQHFTAQIRNLRKQEENTLRSYSCIRNYVYLFLLFFSFRFFNKKEKEKCSNKRAPKLASKEVQIYQNFEWAISILINCLFRI